MSRPAKRQKTGTHQIQQEAPTDTATSPANEDPRLPGERLTDQVSTLIGSVNSLVTLVSKLVDSPPTTAPQNSNSYKETEEIKQLFVDNRVELSESICLDDEMWSRLRATKVVTAAQRDRMQHDKTQNEQIASLLDFLPRRSDKDIHLFCEALKSTNQKHIIKKFLTPSSHNEVPSTRDIRGAKDMGTISEDNKRLLRVHRELIIEHLVITPKIWKRLTEQQIISAEKVERIKKKFKYAEDRVAPVLDHLNRCQEDDFNSFCNILRESKQGHIVDDFLTKE